MQNYAIIINFALWISAVLYSIYRFSISTNSYFKNYDDVYNDFCNSSMLPFRKRDCSDIEWESILHGLQNRWPGLAVHLIVGEILRGFSLKQVVQLWHVSTFLLFAGSEVGFVGVVVIVSIIFLYRLAAFFPRKRFTWFATVVVLVALNCVEKIVLDVNDRIYQDLIIAAHWTILRCVSYNLDEKRKCNIVDALAYCLYLPLFFCGPFIRFEQIEKSYKKNTVISLPEKLRTLSLQLLRFTFWLYFTEISLHFIYVNSTMFHHDFVKNLDYWSLYGYGYTMGQFFHLKYVVMYGITTTIAQFENVEVPKTPRCIGRVHLYSDMWRHFDPGLYTFLTKYIYVPTLYNKTTLNKIFSSLLCFIFVYIWHGTQNCVLIWSVLNFLGVTIEMLFKKRFSNVKLQPQLKRTISCVLASPLLAMSAISNFYFFAGTDIGYIFLIRFLEGGVSNLILLFFLYHCSQVSTQLNKL